MQKLSERVGTFTDSVFRRMTRISDQYGAINLSQGFPDFDPPKDMLDRLAEVAYEGPHQYSVTFGAQNLREALAKKQGNAIGDLVLKYDAFAVTDEVIWYMNHTGIHICHPYRICMNIQLHVTPYLRPFPSPVGGLVI